MSSLVLNHIPTFDSILFFYPYKQDDPVARPVHPPHRPGPAEQRRAQPGRRAQQEQGPGAQLYLHESGCHQEKLLANRSPGIDPIQVNDFVVQYFVEKSF